MGILKWKATKLEYGLVSAIAKRALVLQPKLCKDVVTTEMDVLACHLNGCPLKLEAMLKADDFNFMHDVWGIRQHLDRETGELKDCFLPRFSAPRTVEEVLRG